MYLKKKEIDFHQFRYKLSRHLEMEDSKLRMILKVSELVPRFDGCGDVCEFLDQFETVS